MSDKCVELDDVRRAIIGLMELELERKKLSQQQIHLIFRILAYALPVEHIFADWNHSDHISATVDGWFVRDDI